MVFGKIWITLTSKGSSTGNAQISGIPLAPSVDIAGSGTVMVYDDFGAITGAITIGVENDGVGVCYVDLYQSKYTTTAKSNFITNADFTNTSLINFTFSFMIDR